MCRKGPYDRGAMNRCLAVMTRPGTGTFRRKLPLRSARALLAGLERRGKERGLPDISLVSTPVLRRKETQATCQLNSR